MGDRVDGGHALNVRVQKRLTGGFTLDVNFGAQSGITMIFGESGSGKTTLLRCLAGLEAPDAGAVAVGDRTFFDAEHRIDVPVEDRHVGYVFQHLALFPHMTIADNVAYGVRRLSNGDRHDRIKSIAASFRIEHVLSRRPGTVSGGERQRAALARALVMDPALLLLDEPLSALDYGTQSHIIEDLRLWNAAHQIPILYVTHSHREVFSLGERVLVLDHGGIIADGPPHDVMEAPVQEPVARLAGFENVFDAFVTNRRPAAGTMVCRLWQSEAELEVPLSSAAVETAVRIGVRAGDILVANEQPRGLSARNVLRGTLAALRREGPTVVGTVDAGPRFTIHLTPGAIESLHLAPGIAVWLIIKTYSCRVLSNHAV
jgi:molybdate transport system ATP-binding protein